MAESDITQPSGCTECFRLQVARWLLGLPSPNITGLCTHRSFYSWRISRYPRVMIWHGEI